MFLARPAGPGEKRRRGASDNTSDLMIEFADANVVFRSCKFAGCFLMVSTDCHSMVYAIARAPVPGLEPAG